MRRNKQIAIILSDTLQRAGLQSLLTDYFPPVEITAFDSFDDFPKEGNEFHYYFAKADTFMLNADFFIPRRSRTLIITRDKAPAPASASGYNYLSVTLSQETMIEQLQQFFSAGESNDAGERGKELSLREKDVLKLIAQGCANKDIADKLNISLNTVLTHRKNITAKLGIKTISGLTFYAIMNGLVSSKLIG
ncbi:MAG: LuxR C-terminal-related transcriptional regulator [Tannerellaceae bacterium]|jgi:DNA-binding CsgD family transcriptional regulator|nr:LuxR C-terminal-related transcriptional regulator [Tannerellaceae bacterium]